MKTLDILSISPANKKRVIEHYTKYAPIILQIEHIMEHNQSYSLREIITELQLMDDYLNIYKAFKKYSSLNIGINSNGKSNNSKAAFKNKCKLKDEYLDAIIDLYNKEYTLKQIGIKFDVSAATVMTFMEKHNIKRRSKSEIASKNNNKPGRRDYLRECSIKNYLNQRKTDTQPERDFKEWCDANNIKYIEQYRKVGNKHPYDFFLPKYNLLVEIDGYYWHQKEKQQLKDKQHVEDAIEKGYNIVRICTEQLKQYNGDYTIWIKI